MNKKGQIMEFAFFSIAMLVTIGMVIIIIQMNLPDVTLVGQTPVRVMATQDLGENAKVFTDIVFEQRLPFATDEIVIKRGFNIVEFEGQIIGDTGCETLENPIITADCFPDYKSTYELVLSNMIYNQIQRYDPVNLARNTVIVEASDEWDITTFFEEEITVPLYADTQSYYGVIHRPGATTNEIYTQTPEGYYKRTGLASRTRQGLPDSIVIHYTVTKDVDTTYNVLRQAGLSYHYVIDKDGAIYQFVDEDRTAYHAGCGIPAREGCTPYNERSIGISMINCGYNHTGCEISSCYLDENIQGQCWEAYTEDQIRSVTRLITEITQRNQGIALDRNSILGHDETDPASKVDPGPQFPWNQVIRDARGGMLT